MDDVTKRSDAEAADDPTAMAVDFALVLSRMVNSVKDDPVQLRAVIYELARAKLAGQLVSAASPGERRQMRHALETAIQGVEEFSARKDSILAQQLRAPISAGQQPPPLFSLADTGAEHGTTQASPLPGSSSQPKSTPGINERRTRSTGMLLRAGILLTVAVAVLIAALYAKNKTFNLANLSSLKWKIGQLPDQAPAKNAIARSAQPAAAPAAIVATPVNPLLPTSFGTYALAGEKLFSLEALPGRAPDRRIAISGEIRKPPSTILPNGRASFIVFRRETAGSTPDTAEVRVVARIVRAMSFEDGKPKLSNAEEAWVIRNVAFPYKVAPVRDNPDMYEIRPEDPNFMLEAGRYALIVKGFAYDFSVAGPITATNQCLEQIQAANGIFYSECRKP
jgi:hypothetical protein